MRYLCSLWLCLFCMVSSAAAASLPLPWGCFWGMGQEECGGRVEAAGYARVVGREETSPDKILRRHALKNGLQFFSFTREAPDAAETLKLHLYNNRLYRITVTFDRFGGNFGEKKLAQLTETFSLPPSHFRGRRSGMDIYAWSDGTTNVGFTYKEIPKIPLYFAELEYAHMVVVEELKRLGLQ